MTGKAPADQRGRFGVLVINLGTPDAPEPGAVRRYLAEFLTDPRVIEIPQWLWRPILHGIVLRTRPSRSAHAYSQVWSDEGSPLAAITKRQSIALQQRLGAAVTVDWAMRYGNPGIAGAIAKMVSAGCDRILAAPLYPQYCAATTASAQDAVFAALARLRHQPALRTLPPYYDDPAHIAALKISILRQLEDLQFEPQRLLLSFHGMPLRTVELGDPYYHHCQETARLLGEQLPIPTDIAFQSRFGRAKWIEPATDVVLAAYPEKGVRRIAVAAPGFSADCVETLEELAIRGRDTFLAAGGQRFACLECLNDSPEGMNMLQALIGRQLEGWRSPA
ncbi:MAG TPA: ferrochelatase [Sphingomicrobium sp.]|nr:ferrochelatase [Sphingomicrobium sp.]